MREGIRHSQKRNYTVLTLFSLDSILRPPFVDQAEPDPFVLIVHTLPTDHVG